MGFLFEFIFSYAFFDNFINVGVPGQQQLCLLMRADVNFYQEGGFQGGLFLSSLSIQLLALHYNISINKYLLYSTLIFVILILIMQIRKGSRILFVDKEKKINPKPTQDTTPSISSIITKEPMTQSQFNYQYSQFTLDLPIHKQVKQNLKYLYQLYSNMCEHGGLISVLATNKLKLIISDMSLKFPQLSNLSFQNVLEHYVKFYLFSFQVVIHTGKRIQNQKLVCLAVPRFIEDKELKQCLTNRQSGIKLYEGDMLVLSQLCKHLDLKQQTFSIKTLTQRQGQENIKVLVQESVYSNRTEGDGQVPKSKNNKYSQKLNKHNNQLTNYQIGLQRFKNFPNTDHFEQEPSKCKIQTIQANLKDYINYFNLYESSHENNRSVSINDKFHSYYKSADQHPSRILSAQFDPKDEFFIQEISKKMESTFLCFKQKHDLLSYADEDIPGVTLPIFSFHLHGTWSGGAQQSFGLSKVDINFGPDEIIWYSIPNDHINKFYAAFKSQSSFGVEKIDGEWIEELDWFIERKIPIKKVIQKKGDGIIIGSGSLTWFKSVGKSLHISWNLMTKAQKQIVATTNRFNKIREIKFVYTNQNLRMKEKEIKVPLKSILLKTLNHEEYSIAKKKEQIETASLSLSSVVIIREHLKRCYIQQQKYLNQMIVREDLLNIKYKLYHLFDAESFCANCNGEILNYFVNFNGLCCLQCLSKQFVIKKTLQLKDKTLYYKYDPYWLYQLIYYGGSRSIVEDNLYFSEFHQLCSGQFILSNSLCTKKAQRQAIISTERAEWEMVIKEYEQEQSRTRQSQHFSKFLKIFTKKIQNKSGTDIQEDEISKNCCIQTNLSLSTEVTDEQINSYSSSNSNSKTNMKSNETQYREYSVEAQRRKQRRRYRDDDRSVTSGQAKQSKYRHENNYKVHYDRDDQRGKYYQKSNYIEKEKRYWRRDLHQQQESQTSSKYQNNRKNQFYRYSERGSKRLKR